jgi:hypothetical protein
MECTRVHRRGSWNAVVAVSAALVATALVGCGGGANKIVLPKHPVNTTSTTGLPGDDPCKLLKRADVTDAFGMPFAAGTPVAGATAQCEFRAGTSSLDPAAPVVTLHVQGEVTIASFETGKLTAPGGVRDVEGVGDQAYYSALMGRLWVRRGVFGFDVGATPALVPEPDGEQRLIPLASLVLERHR